MVLVVVQVLRCRRGERRMPDLLRSLCVRLVLG